MGLSACMGPDNDVTWKKSRFFELENCLEGNSCYFQYPVDALVYEKEGVGNVDFSDCVVDFGSNFAPEEGLEVKLRQVSDEESGSKKFFESYFNQNTLVYYVGGVEGVDNKFWVYREGEDVSKCTALVDDLVNSFTTKPMYYNDRFSYKCEILPDFKMENMVGGDGIVMRRRDQSEDEDVGTYNVEVGVISFENVVDYQDLSHYVQKEYPGYTVDFSGNGVFINEVVSPNAIRHFLMMNEGRDKIFKAYLKVPQKCYNDHLQWFDDWILSAEFI